MSKKGFLDPHPEKLPPKYGIDVLVAADNLEEIPEKYHKIFIANVLEEVAKRKKERELKAGAVPAADEISEFSDDESASPRGKKRKLSLNPAAESKTDSTARAVKRLKTEHKKNQLQKSASEAKDDDANLPPTQPHDSEQYFSQNGSQTRIQAPLKKTVSEEVIGWLNRSPSPTM